MNHSQTYFGNNGGHTLIHLLIGLFAGKRRYDRKQSGYGGQSKPVFRKYGMHRMQVQKTIAYQEMQALRIGW